MKTDVLIIGCGIAGATAALELAKNPNCDVTVITRSGITDSNSIHAQGGIVSRGVDDSAHLLVEDVMKAGGGLSALPAVKLLADEGPPLVQRLIVDELGVAFDRNDAHHFSFGLEAAHSTKRILHVADATGKAIMTALLSRLKTYTNIHWLAEHTAVDLVTDSGGCDGALVFDQQQKQMKKILATATVLATGGVGQLFLYTTNPLGARGDGVAMAYRAHAHIENAEYVQFHPTALAGPGNVKFLISEAVRGEGGRLKTLQGKLFDDLGPRDVLSQAIYQEIKIHHSPHVLLDIASYQSPAFIRRRFPTIYEYCLAAGIDITKDPIPVVPAAHYFCGGIKVDLWGRTSISGLYAVGEVTCTGVHGANRLASTSLLEGLVWGARAARHIATNQAATVLSTHEKFTKNTFRSAARIDEEDIRVMINEIQSVMWEHVGLVRKTSGLEKAVAKLTVLQKQIEDRYHNSLLTDDLVGLRNTAQAALMVAQAALHNPISKGCHYRIED